MRFYPVFCLILRSDEMKKCRDLPRRDEAGLKGERWHGLCYARARVYKLVFAFLRPSKRATKSLPPIGLSVLPSGSPLLNGAGFPGLP